jgi:hypothetical protein
MISSNIYFHTMEKVGKKYYELKWRCIKDHFTPKKKIEDHFTTILRGFKQFSEIQIQYELCYHFIVIIIWLWFT